MNTKINFLDDIERLRGFACLIVLIHHIAWICPLRFIYNIVPHHLLIGDSGVQIFFAISGFVVTLSLRDKLQELSGATFLERLTAFKSTLFSFYKKRFFRIFPVVFFVFVLVGIYLEISEKNSNWMLAFFRAPAEIFFGVFNNSLDVFQANATEYKVQASGIGPFWTLAVESQFYLLWPLMLLICKNNNDRSIMSLFCGCLFLFIIQPLAAGFIGVKYYLIYTNVSALFLGSFFAFLYTEDIGKNVSKFYAKIITAVLVIIIWCYPNAIENTFFSKIVPIIASIFVVVFAAFVKDSFNFLIFGKFFDFLGSRSYSFYAVQLSLANYVVLYTNSIYFPKDSFSEYEFFVYQLIIFFVVLFIVTEIVYRFIEKPFRAFGRK